MRKDTYHFDNVVSRREFLETTGTMAAGGLIANISSKIELPKITGKQNSMKNKKKQLIGEEQSVVLAGVPKGAPNKELMKSVRDVALQATDFSWLKPGDSVFIKPALNSGNPYPATTNAFGIMAIVELLKEKGAGRVIVSDMSGIEHVKLTPDKLKRSTRVLMHASGIAQAAMDAGAELHFPEEAGWDAFFEDNPVDDTFWKAGIMMPNILQDVDHIICMPRCSRHLLLGSSLGMKSTVGYWRTDSRLEYHKNASTIQEKTADANTVRCLREKQRLVLTTATQILTTLGPDNGFIAEPETGLVIASESIVAHDMVSLAWLLKNRQAMSEEEIARARDPYKRQGIVSTLNRVVVSRLGGIGESIGAENLIRNDIETIRDDRVLNRAYEVFGGTPDVDLTIVEESVPQDLKAKLTGMLARSDSYKLN